MLTRDSVGFYLFIVAMVFGDTSISVDRKVLAFFCVLLKQ